MNGFLSWVASASTLVDQSIRKTAISSLVRAAALLLTVVGCSHQEGEPLSQWKLVSTDGAPTIELPAALALPDRDTAFVLERKWTPPTRPALAVFELVLQGVQAPASLEVDGVRAQLIRDGFGIAPGGLRTVVPQRFSIPHSASGEPRTLRLRLENTWYQARWVEGVPRVIEAGVLTRKENIALVANLNAAWLSLGVTIQVGVMFLAVFLFGGRRSAYLWFGVQALTTTVIPLYQLGYTQTLFGAWEGGAYGAFLAVGNTVGVRFSHEFFGLKRPHPSLWLATLVGVVVPLLLQGPFVFTPYGAPLINLLISLSVAYQILLCTRLWIQRGLDVRVALFGLSWLILAALATADQLAWWGIASPLEGARVGALGIAAFAFLQSILVANHYRVSLDSGDSLNQKLEERLRDLVHRKAEVDMLNTQLRVQVQERSQQMFLALSLAASRGVAPVLEAGQFIHGRYLVLGRLGSGGMGYVYRVKRESDGRMLALKVAHNVDGVSLARLAREATMIARIAHRHVVELVDVDVAPEGFAYLAMEIAAGTTLGELDVNNRSQRWCLDLLDQVLDGLSALHELGIVHRDLKPSNVVVEDDGDAPRVKLIDFGISREPSQTAPLVADATAQVGYQLATQADDTITIGFGPTPKSHSSSLTRDGLLAGTPAYMAPELAQGERAASAASDMFAFGVMVYRVFMHCYPFAEPAITCMLRGDEQPPPASLQLAWMNLSLREGVERALSRIPQKRPTAFELRGLIAEARAGNAPLLAAGIAEPA